MNYIQKAWLYALRPITPLINDKLAKRSGVLGRIGRFFAVGPRQFGYHPINKWLSWINLALVDTIGMALHRHAFLKQTTGRGFFTIRSGAFFMLFGPIMIFWNLFYWGLPMNADIEEGTSLQYLKERIPLAPLNALNDRVSAHFTQINGYYSQEMAKRYMDLIESVGQERKFLDDKTKKTKYARPGYKYIEAHSKVDGQ